MAVRASSRLTRRLAGAAALAALAVLGGCVVAPVGPYDVGTPVAYPAGSYGYPVYGDAYYGSPYYSAPYWGPAVSLGVYGWSGGHNHWDHNRPSGHRPDWGGQGRPPPGNWGGRPPGPPPNFGGGGGRPPPPVGGRPPGGGNWGGRPPGGGGHLSTPAGRGVWP